MDGDAGPGEGQQCRAVLVGDAGQQGVQRGVEQGRVQDVASRVGALLLGQGDLGVDLAVAAPYPPQTLESRTVRISHIGQPVIDPVERHLAGAGGRPRQRRLTEDAGGRGQGTARVQRPRTVRGDVAVVEP
ncbi:hypothetical protein B0E38_05415 [Streptomyces sp. 111WW2]|nr:hypothetical protein B0E38_05415 [Streptomyces sp. 111WW2]